MNTNASNGLPANLGASQAHTIEGQGRTGVIWPAEHRNPIANTAANVLNAIPENSGKEIAALQILDMLGYNPSYIELCELIEGIGFRLDPARFAKTLLAAIPAVNAAPAQPAESKVSRISNKSLTFKEYQSFNRGFSNFTNGSSSIGPSDSAPEQASGLSVESITGVSVPLEHSEIASNNTIPGSRGPGSRGPYQKTRERMSEAQVSPSGSRSRRERITPRKDGLPPARRLSNVTPNRSYLMDSALTTAQNLDNQVTTQPVHQVSLKASYNSRLGNVQERTAPTHEGQVISERDLVITRSNETTRHLAGISSNSSHGIWSHSDHPEGWRSSAPLAPPPGSNTGDVSSGIDVAASAPLPPTPLTKEMAARKRTFAEIIDLTSEDTTASVGDHPLIVSKFKRIGDTNLKQADGYDGAQRPQTPNTSFKQQPSHTTATTKALIPIPPQFHRPISSELAGTSPVPSPYKDFEYIVEPIDKSVALRNSRYDPKTIARDILVATARHPYQRGLNAHLESLKVRFIGVDDSSDLSTFRWDMVDPGGPPVGSANMPLPPEEMQKSSSGVSDFASSMVALEGVKLPIGRGPLRPTRGGGSLQGRQGPTVLQTQSRTPVQPSGLRFSSTIESSFAVVIESATLTTSTDADHPRKGHPEGIDSSSTARRRGRPPKNLSATSQLGTPSLRRIGRPLKALSSGVRLRGNSAGRKVGRPRIHQLSESKPKGRPRKPDPKLVAPKFIPFLCEWRDCRAELHNLETLRTHIYSVHNKVQASGAIVCKWAKCGLTRQVHEKSTPETKLVHEDHDFASMEEFKDHTEKVHLIPFAWHMGDGPRSSTLDGSESDASAYLSDIAGQQITPSVASQVVEGGNARINNARRLAQQKRLIDPALESPVVLVTPGMAANFYMPSTWKPIKASKRLDSPEFD